jgi:hypothetical protein
MSRALVRSIGVLAVGAFVGHKAECIRVRSPVKARAIREDYLMDEGRVGRRRIGKRMGMRAR